MSEDRPLILVCNDDGITAPGIAALVKVMKKLGNENFVNNAPAKVVEMEQKKKADAEEKIKALTEQIKSLK